MNIKAITIYPIKSLPGIQIDKSEIVSTGLLNDRLFVLTKVGEEKPEKRWISLRSHPQLVHFDLSLRGNDLRICHSTSSDTIVINLADAKERAGDLKIDIWDDEVITGILEEEINEYFSDLLNIGVQLAVYKSRVISRERYRDFPDGPTLQDGFPISLANTESLIKLNNELVSNGYEPVPMSRFRANIVINGEKPFEEDGFDTVSIGDVELRTKESIPRCIITQVDTNKGVVRKDQPVVKTLTEINNIGRPDDQKKLKPRFSIGLYPRPEDIGKVISVNDQIVPSHKQS
jgi:uncharacterized protein YcbX